MAPHPARSIHADTARTRQPAAEFTVVGDVGEARAATHRTLISTALADDLAEAYDVTGGRSASATVRGYAADLRALFEYLADVGQPPELPLDPMLVAAFIASEASPRMQGTHLRPPRAAATITRRIAAIAKAHQLQGLTDPTKDQRVREAVAGARRALDGTTASHTKDALKLDDLERIVAAIPQNHNAGRRDRAILLVGIATALRRSDLVALDVGDVQFEPWGMLVSIRKSEASHLASGALAIRSDDNVLCAVHALQAWLHGGGIQAGPIFRRVRKGDHITEQRLNDRSVATIVKQRARAAGMAAGAVDRLSGHSLRSGGTTAAARGGLTSGNPFDQTAQVLRRARNRTLPDEG